MEMLVLVEVVGVSLIFLIRHIYKMYQKHKDKNRVKTVLNYLQHRTGNIEVEKLQKMLGVDSNEVENKSK